MSEPTLECEPGVLRVFQSKDETKWFYTKIAKVYDLLAELSEQPDLDLGRSVEDGQRVAVSRGDDLAPNLGGSSRDREQQDDQERAGEQHGGIVLAWSACGKGTVTRVSAQAFRQAAC